MLLLAHFRGFEALYLLDVQCPDTTDALCLLTHFMCSLLRISCRRESFNACFVQSVLKLSLVILNSCGNLSSFYTTD